MNGYSYATIIAAEGARVAIVTCLTCGAALLVDPRDEVGSAELHNEWHEQIEAARKGEEE